MRIYMIYKRSFTLLQMLKTVFGLFLFSFGTYMLIRANIGLDPWDALSMGISYHTPLSYGIAHTGVSILILLVDIMMKEKIGYGTLFDALLVGNFVDLITWVNPIPMQGKLLPGIVLMIAGLFLMAYGQFLYMSAGMGCGPRDSFLVGVGRRLCRMPIGAVDVLILAIVLFAAFLLGGPIGIGTVISTFGVGIVMQIVFRMLHFEPRSVIHRNLIETTKMLVGSYEERA